MRKGDSDEKLSTPPNDDRHSTQLNIDMNPAPIGVYSIGAFFAFKTEFHKTQKENQEILMKMKKWKRVFSGILAAVTVLSTCMPGSVMASSEEVEVCYPTLEEIIDQLDEDEIVRPGDYTVPVGSDLDISLDFTNFNITDWMKVNIYFDGAYNEDGE